MNMKSDLRCASTAIAITPPVGTSLAGYFTDRKAEGLSDNLYASILIVEKNASRVVWIACDLIGFPADFALPIRQAIASKLGIPVGAVVMSATHTHTGPVTSGPLANMEYLCAISDQIIEAAVTVNARLAPGFLEYGAGVDSRFAFNRRYFMKNGTVLTNPGANNPDVIGPAGRVDHSLQVIKVLDANQRTLALVVNLANHADTTDGNFILTGTHSTAVRLDR